MPAEDRETRDDHTADGERTTTDRLGGDHHGGAVDDPTAVPFDDVSSHDELIRQSRTYFEHAIDHYDLAVDCSLVEWDVSTRAKRRAAAVKRPRIPDAAVGEPIDWEAIVRERDGAVAGSTDASAQNRRTCTVVLTWAAFEAFTTAEWTDTLRHELIHVEQFQRFGTTNHGSLFRQRAEAVDASLKCRRFSTPKYRVRCTDCGGVVARRYRECPLVRKPDRYRGSCCSASLAVERVADD